VTRVARVSGGEARECGRYWGVSTPSFGDEWPSSNHYDASMDDEGEARGAAAYYGFSAEKADAARETLSPWPEGFAVRFTALAQFAKEFGVDLVSLAQFVAWAGRGIEPWERGSTISREDWDRIDQAIEETRLSQSGAHWAETILSLLNELDSIRGTEESG